MEFLNIFVDYLILLIIVLVGVAFVTLLEQKILAGTQIRVGPNYVGYWGVLQPFADAVKLFNKEGVFLRASNYLVYFLRPVVRLGLSLFLWACVPQSYSGCNMGLGVIFFIVISGLGVFPILLRGWSSNCKYSILGSLRAVAQIVSYEVRLAFVLLGLVVLRESLNFVELLAKINNILGIFVFFPLGLVWFASRLAETNRTPYDFAEGESELVSGFNTEYRSGGFTLIFIAEYRRILFISIFFSLFFLSRGARGFSLVVKGVLVSCFFIWVRGTLPRFRYDKLMGLSWKRFLPVRLGLIFYYFFIRII